MSATLLRCTTSTVSGADSVGPPLDEQSSRSASEASGRADAGSDGAPVNSPEDPPTWVSNLACLTKDLIVLPPGWAFADLTLMNGYDPSTLAQLFVTSALTDVCHEFRALASTKIGVWLSDDEVLETFVGLLTKTFHARGTLMPIAVKTRLGPVTLCETYSVDNDAVQAAVTRAFTHLFGTEPSKHFVDRMCNCFDCNVDVEQRAVDDIGAASAYINAYWMNLVFVRGEAHAQPIKESVVWKNDQSFQFAVNFEQSRECRLVDVIVARAGSSASAEKNWKVQQRIYNTAQAQGIPYFPRMVYPVALPAEVTGVNDCFAIELENVEPLLPTQPAETAHHAEELRSTPSAKLYDPVTFPTTLTDLLRAMEALHIHVKCVAGVVTPRNLGFVQLRDGSRQLVVYGFSHAMDLVPDGSPEADWPLDRYALDFTSTYFRTTERSEIVDVYSVFTTAVSLLLNGRRPARHPSGRLDAFSPHDVYVKLCSCFQALQARGAAHTDDDEHLQLKMLQLFHQLRDCFRWREVRRCFRLDCPCKMTRFKYMEYTSMSASGSSLATTTLNPARAAINALEAS